MLLPLRTTGQKQRLIIVIVTAFMLTGCSGSSSTTPSVPRQEKKQNDTSLNDVLYRPLSQLTPASNQWSAPADPELTPLTPAQPSQSKTADPEPQHRWGCMVHRTQPGDTLYSIARQYYGDTKQHWRLIGQRNLDALNEQGQLLADVFIYLPLAYLKYPSSDHLPSRQLPQAYITVPNDTLKDIAHWLGTDPQTLKTLNHLTTSPDQPLPPGTNLKCR